MNIQSILSEQLQIDEKNISNVISLLDEGSTVAFISRYRKEKTGNLSDVDVRNIEKNLNKLRNIEKRQEEIINALESSNNLTEELKEQILATNSLTLLEDMYAPFKKKRKTRADKARELGLEPLLKYLLDETKSPEEATNFAKDFLNEDIGSSKEAIEKSLDILAEDISNNIQAKNIVRRDGMMRARLKASQKDDSNGVYQTYYDFNKKVRDLKSYQILAINRGEKEEALSVKVEFSDDYNKKLISDLYDSSNYYQRELINISVNDAYKRLILPSITTELRNYLTDMAEDESIKVFSNNLKPYLLQKPIKGKTVMGLDPGFRTGCKVAVVDPNGKYLNKAVIYPVEPHKKEKESMDILTDLIKEYNVSLIALGNATASRETEIFVNKLISENNLDIAYAVVNEAGASVYSASTLGEEEFPDLDVTIRGAISMARRLQDPMAELVKIEPKHIGIGQYQHDLNEKKLDEELSKVVEDTVNEVGVTINNASYKLLSYVSGLSPKLARRIEEEFKEGNLIYRKDLKNVKGLGDKTYQLAAGFLRFPDSPELLDNTAVHPESYRIAKKLKDYNLETIDISEVSQKLEVGEPTLKDIIEELKKPGRDPREDNPEILTKSEIMSIDDLKIDDEMMGKVRNITDFGAFVDIGVGVDGLVHISNMSNKFIKDPNEVLTNSDIVKVKVIEIDKDRQRIGLSMKDIN
ncbi:MULTISPECIES: Tex-like N-terminal domain-containing protein [Anaerococcus]|uniref:RNA-binding transcriptional accessory protein n=1 Tax=Anaerococcus nagyae TaxID=1755241 RepID=A0A3E2TFS0_9FIRM|nr:MULTISPECIES: Tex family protein [Anaerococcus]MDU1828979.1 Tex family protein [Anaerococcus sp.]MDU1864056.1 Tex family protein [Anaerococcus sp.]RGB74718.1 RNA-binding transcriptional accessory protein [Anaerococcus nagyae]